MPDDGGHTYYDIYLRPHSALTDGSYSYSLKKRSKKLVHIPPHVREGQIIRLAGMGVAGKDGESQVIYASRFTSENLCYRE